MSKREAKPKELEPWHRRPWPKRGTRGLPKLYAAIGRTLSQWERYEHELSHLFATLVTDGYPTAAERAFSAVRTFEGRSDMLRAASEAYFYGWPNDKLQNEFKDIFRDAKGFSERRNEIAHGMVDHFEPLPFPESPRYGGHRRASYALYPSSASFKTRALSGVPAYCYAAPELDYFYLEFRKLMNPAIRLAPQIVTNRREHEASKDKLLLRYRATTSRGDPHSGHK